ncbi:GspH/FimT family pseudopilin [Acinetobacter sp. CFCC 10889]|uniref:GspH/FimT family pseudopilin n=1 Tax=Acinetobacter sp. CFCC 10889 TaxID=1775557 RepID=UPI000DD094DB|nr:GspH/FimT family pseudopilin [Acinetobacter sp. CFCC 10889]
MYFYYKQHGLTLVELIVCMCIIGIIACVAAPYFLHILQENEQKNIFPLLDQQIKLAKNSAVLHHTDVVICSSANLNTCQNDQWALGILIFLDLNKNKRNDANEIILATTPINLHYGTLKWAGGATHPKVIAFQGETGLPKGSSGSFYYCNLSHSIQHLRLILSPMSHFRKQTISTC